MSRRFWVPLVVAVAVLTIGGWVFRERLLLAAYAAATPSQSLAARETLLKPDMRFYPPADGQPPYPTVIQFHGCGGMNLRHQEQWAHAANGAGYMAVIVDSFTPRHISHDRALATVCKGKALIGQERAGDVLAALDMVRQRDDVDAKKIVLAGWSHGSWSVMDYLALTDAHGALAGLKGPAPKEPAIAGVILFYPHCGIGAWTHLIGWRSSPPTLGLFAEEDTVVDRKACPALFARLAAAHKGISTHLYPGVDHAFDNPYVAVPSQSAFNAPARDDALERYDAFLATLK